jgi:hypothetical protein
VHFANHSLQAVAVAVRESRLPGPDYDGLIYEERLCLAPERVLALVLKASQAGLAVSIWPSLLHEN